MTFAAVLALLVSAAGSDVVPRAVSFPTDDGGMVFADEYGTGERGVVLAHGGRFTKESWTKQAPILADAGYRVVAIDFRGAASRAAGHSRRMPGPKELVLLDGSAHAQFLFETDQGERLMRELMRFLGS